MKYFREREKNILYTMYIETTRVTSGDSVTYHFSRPIYIRSLIASSSCYYSDDSFITPLIGDGTPAKFPFDKFEVVGTAKYSVNNTGVGTYTRLSAGMFYTFRPEPLRVRRIFIAPITGSTLLEIRFTL